MRAIDFGTSSTAAAQRAADHEAELVTFGGAYAFPSSVAVHEGDLVCGEEADAMLPADPTSGTRAPKLIVAHGGTAFLEGREVGVGQIIAAILHEADMGDQRAEPGPRILTHPADWEEDGPRCAALLEGASAAGFDDVELISEPEAVAWHVADRVELGEAFAVFDLGGGTCDMAALRREASGFELLARPRAETIGGELADALLLELLIERLGERDPDAATALHDAERLRADGRAASIDAEQFRWLQCLIGAERQMRTAKTRLSSRDSVSVRLPPPPRGVIEITRTDLAQRMRPHLERAADGLGAVLDEAGLERADTRVVLSGAASVMPIVAEVLRERVGVTLTPVRPAKGAVALGALAALEARRGATPAARRDAPLPPDPKRAQRNQANVTKLIQDPDWEDAPDEARAWLLETVLRATEEEEIVDLLTDVGHDGNEAETVLLITSARLLWARPAADDTLVTGDLRFADLAGVKPATSADGGLTGLCLVADGNAPRFELRAADEAEILQWVEYVAERAPGGPTPAGAALVARLRELTEHAVYKAAAASSRAWLAHCLAQHEAPEESKWVEACGDGVKLLTTSERLIWAQDSDSRVRRSVQIADVSALGPCSDVDRGMHGFVVVVDGEEHTFIIGGAEINVRHLLQRLEAPTPQWMANFDQLRAFPQWGETPVAGQHWLVDTVLRAALGDAPDETLLWCVRCTMGNDWSTTTTVILTNHRLLWARVGTFAGLSCGWIGYGSITAISTDEASTTIVYPNSVAKFGFTDTRLLAELRAQTKLS